MECLNMSDYFQQLERHLDCPKPFRSSFLNQTRRMAEGFLETLEPDVLERYRKRKKLALRGCIAVLVAVLIGVSIWCTVL